MLQGEGAGEKIPGMRHPRVATTYGPRALSGGGGGHHHHGGGPRYPGPWPGWLAYDPYPAVDLFVVDDKPPVAACPTARLPVLASDGLVYDNACLARAAGVTVVKQVGRPAKGGLGAWSASIQSDGVMDVTATKAFVSGVIAGLIGGALARAILAA